MKPVIGITMGLERSGQILNRGKSASFIWNEYGEQIRRAGGEPIHLDYTVDPAVAAGLCSGIIISGGEDMDPKFYGETIHNTQILEPTDRTSWERRLIDECDKRELPILGICYGAQLLNVHYGGTLYQDIYVDDGAKINHGSGPAPAMHDVTFLDGFLGIEPGSKLNVNSRHHQAVRELAPGFKVVAAADDGIIEAIAGRGHFGLQWHAESDESGHTMYRNYVAMCSRMLSPALTDGEIAEVA